MKISNRMDRRLDILKMEGNGSNRVEIVRHLSEKYDVTRRTLYYDFEKRGKWQPAIGQYADRKKLVLRLLNRYEQIYRMAAFKHMQSSHDNIQLGALKVMLEANDRLFEKLVLTELSSEVEKIQLHLGIKE